MVDGFRRFKASSTGTEEGFEIPADEDAKDDNDAAVQSIEDGNEIPAGAEAKSTSRY